MDAATRRILQKERQRISWTRFKLPQEQNWPEWPTSYPNRYRGPFTDVAGCQQLCLGRQVDYPDEAVFIVFWESADALNDFQHSPACGEFLQGLGCENESLLSLQYAKGLTMESALPGRVTLNILTIPYTGVPDRETWRDAILSAFKGFMPKGGGTPNSPQIFRWSTYAWVDDEQQKQPTPADTAGQRQATCYQFYCWIGAGTTVNEEEVSAKDPESYGLWAERMARAMPPVEAWVQERWHIKREPIDIDPEEEDDEYYRNYVVDVKDPVAERLVREG
ncbi:hypothetical protein F5Y12DRAFT_754291 [Xylaria sp. FL1777]|nr:hypothetical protein F5Y12DRAFT_754291 [Xylaria sp. FL1777]